MNEQMKQIQREMEQADTIEEAKEIWAKAIKLDLDWDEMNFSKFRSWGERTIELERIICMYATGCAGVITWDTTATPVRVLVQDDGGAEPHRARINEYQLNANGELEEV